MSSKLRTRKYDIVRSQSLHRPRDGVIGTYRSLCSSPLPPSAYTISSSSPSSSQSVAERSRVKRRENADDKSLTDSKAMIPKWASGTTPKTSDERSAEVPPRRPRIPFELFDSLPESKVDPETPPAHGVGAISCGKGNDTNNGVNFAKNVKESETASQLEAEKVNQAKKAIEARQFQVVFIQHRPPSTNLHSPKSKPQNDADDGSLLSERKYADSRGQESKVINGQEQHGPRKNKYLEYQQVDDNFYLAKSVKPQRPQSSLLCQEHSDGTVFGVLHTPTTVRRKSCPAPSFVSLIQDNRNFRSGQDDEWNDDSGAGFHQRYYDGGDQVCRPDDDLSFLPESYNSLSQHPHFDNERYLPSDHEYQPPNLREDYEECDDTGDINECYNFRLILPKEIQQAKRQDFCRSMLCQDDVDNNQSRKNGMVLNGDQSAETSASLPYSYFRTPPQLVRERYAYYPSSGSRPTKYVNARTPVNIARTDSVQNSNTEPEEQGATEPCDNTKLSPSLKSPTVVKEVLKKMASQPSGMLPSSTQNATAANVRRVGNATPKPSSAPAQRILYNSASRAENNEDSFVKATKRDNSSKNDLEAEAEAMRAIQDLDKSLSEALQEPTGSLTNGKLETGTTPAPMTHSHQIKQTGDHRESEADTRKYSVNQRSMKPSNYIPPKSTVDYHADSAEVQRDNLIEEMYLSESKPKFSTYTSSTSSPPASSHPKISDRYTNHHRKVPPPPTASPRNINASSGLKDPGESKANAPAEGQQGRKINVNVNGIVSHPPTKNGNQNVPEPLDNSVSSNSLQYEPSSRTNSYSVPAYQFYKRYRPDLIQNGGTGHFPITSTEDTICAEIHRSGDGDCVDDLDGAVVARTSTASSVDSGNSSHHQGHFVVVAIDFGTTYSGYAFSFTRDPENIHMMRKWEGGDPGVNNQKTPTILLLTPNGQFHSFGFTARDYYNDMEPQEAKKWMYFEKFKMSLHHNENLTRETQIAAANGKVMSAVIVFAHALRYFRDHALQELSDQSATTILNEDVRWVVTVPAIWRQPAKQFMRTAAYEAGIASPECSDQLLIALEPEAASIYCRRLRMNQLVPEGPVQQRLSVRRKNEPIESQNSEPAILEDKGFCKYSSNPTCLNDVLDCKKDHYEQHGGVHQYSVQTPMRTKYMVVDCGGGTVDITVHELQDKQGTLKELHKATGGPHGSVGVDLEFECLLEDIFGADFISQFKAKRPASFVDLMNAFEARKRNANPYQNNPLNISLPFSFIDFYKKCKGGSIESAIKKYGDKDIQYRSSQGMIRLESTAMLRLFEPTLTKIKEHIADILNNPDVQKISYLFLVGGFAESQVLQKAIRDEFSSQLTVIIPQGVSLAVLRGAVLFGLDPTIVNVRRSRMTYGVGILNRFIHGVHPPEKLVIKDGIQWCADVFDKFVTTDQSVGLGDTVRRSYTPATVGQACSIIHIYCSERDDVQFITDPGVQRCGTLMLDLTDSKHLPNVPRRREIETCMIFGDTEIKASARDVVTGKCVKVEIDFLNH